MSDPLTTQIRPYLLLREVTGLTGGGSTKLDGIVTANLVPPLVSYCVVGSIVYFYELRAGTDAESAPTIIRPNDFAASTNEKVWALLGAYMGATTFTGQVNINSFLPKILLTASSNTQSAVAEFWDGVARIGSISGICSNFTTAERRTDLEIASDDGDVTIWTGGVLRATFADAGLTVVGRLTANKWSNDQSALTYGATVAIDFDDTSARTLALTGNWAPTTSNKAAGRMWKCLVTADASERSFTWPAWLGAADLPATLAAGKSMALILECWGTTDELITASAKVFP